MTTLIEFLRARLDEDEQRARRAAAADEQARDDDGPRLGEAEDYLGEALAVHIWRHSPKRVLAQVDAKRRLLEWMDGVDEWLDGDRLASPDYAYCNPARKLLALPYVDHPDYDQDWKP